MNLQELMGKIKDELKLRNYSRKTVESYLFCLSDYFKYIKNVKKEPDVRIIKKYLLEKQGRGLSPQTINLYLSLRQSPRGETLPQRKIIVHVLL